MEMEYAQSFAFNATDIALEGREAEVEEGFENFEDFVAAIEADRAAYEARREAAKAAADADCEIPF